MKYIKSYHKPWWMSGRTTWIIALTLGGCVSMAIAFYWRLPATELSSKIDFAARTAVGSAAFFSIFLGYQTIRLNIHQSQIKGAFEFLARYDQHNERENRKIVNRLFGRTGAFDEYKLDLIPPSRMEAYASCITSENAKAIEAVLSFYEDVALSIISGYANEAILHRSLSLSAIRYINGLRPFIKKEQFVEGPEMYQDAEKLFKCWISNISVTS